MKWLVYSLWLLVGSGSVLAQAPAERVILITLDGLRWEELFAGADSSLMTNGSYVKDTAPLQEAFWADAPLERRSRLMPFVWSTVVNSGQIWGNPAKGSVVETTNDLLFSYRPCPTDERHHQV